MCEYCSEEHRDYREEIAYFSIPLFSKEYIDNALLNFSIRIDDQDNLEMYAFASLDHIAGDDGKEFKKKINYCPICGRKLESDKM